MKKRLIIVLVLFAMSLTYAEAGGKKRRLRKRAHVTVATKIETRNVVRLQYNVIKVKRVAHYDGMLTRRELKRISRAQSMLDDHVVLLASNKPRRMTK